MIPTDFRFPFSRRPIARCVLTVLIIFALILTALTGIDSARAADPVESDEPDAIHEYPITDSDRDHWAYQPLVVPRPPDRASLAARVREPGELPGTWLESEIDRFVLDELLDRSLRPLPEADRLTLLRRLHFDLIGLPPTTEEIERFLKDDSPGAYERLVTRLLASPEYGHRWAQHWLDLARVAETDGFEHDKVRPDAWRYRQWLVDALNDDMPYDRFVRLQLAGDLTGNEDDAIATTFCLAGPDMPDLNEQDLRRHDKLNEITGTVGEVLLGLQMACAQCHDHKYDPISQADFYRLRAVFEPAIAPLKRDVPIRHLVSQPSAPSARLYHRGELDHPGPEVRPRPPRIASLETTATEDSAAESERRFDRGDPRSHFADWLFEPDNPLTARVIANRVWQHHFGRSLADNPNDFGIIADGPSHPELLDHLACRLRDGGWSLKRLHREIVCSAVYRQAGDRETDDPEVAAAVRHNRELDPDNRHYSRYPRRRLEGELIRDALLAVSGELDIRQGGPSVMPPLPSELTETLLKGQWKAAVDRADHVRRSIYLFARRNLRYPIFEAFDRPDAGAVCGRRDQSTTPIQSLLMLNSELTFDTANRLRDRLIREVRRDPQATLTGSPEQTNSTRQRLIELLYLTTLSRPPSQQESRPLVEYLSEHSDGRVDDALLTLAIAMLNSNEFLHVD